MNFTNHISRDRRWNFSEKYREFQKSFSNCSTISREISKQSSIFYNFFVYRSFYTPTCKINIASNSKSRSNYRANWDLVSARG